MNTGPELTIVLVTYNSAAWISACLGGLPDALAGRPARIVVVDNASTDGTADVVEREHPEALLIRNEHNEGFAAAVNAGAATVSTPWLLLLNPDTEARPGSLRALLEFAEANPGHGLYGGRTLRPNGTLEPSSCWGLPSLWSTACFALGLSTVFRHTRLFDPESLGRWQRDTVREVGMITGCLLLIDRGTWDRLHGFDERYFVYGEDADLAARARRIGSRPIITPDAEVVHAVGESSPGSEGSMLLALAGKITYARTHFTGISAVLAVGLLRAGVALRAGGARVTGRGKGWQIGWRERHRWWDGFPERPRT